MNKTVLHIIFLILISKASFGQENLVPNGSFEEYDVCPSFYNSLGVTDLGAVDWRVPTIGSPDYYNECSNQEVGIPQNVYGYQKAQEGKAYAGLFTFDSNINYREYISARLTSPLNAGDRYFWCFWLSLSDSVDFASNNIGIALTNTYQTNSNSNVFHLQVYGNSEEIIVDSDKWILISGTFIAKGKEEYIYIGNFYENSELKLKQLHTNSLVGPSAYYYIDNIYLGITPCSNMLMEIPNIFSPNNDGINDYCKINHEGVFGGSIEIFNRWGNLIFFGDLDDAWDGTYNGTLCHEGIYFIKVSYYDFSANKQEYKTSFIHLVR